MLKKILHPNFKKMYTIQYITFCIYSIPLIRITLLSTVLLVLGLTDLFNIFEIHGELAGVLSLLTLGSPALWVTILPMGLGVFGQVL